MIFFEKLYQALVCHFRVGGNPVFLRFFWILAFARMTVSAIFQSVFEEIK